MEEEKRSVKWILWISLILLVISYPSFFPLFSFFAFGFLDPFYHNYWRLTLFEPLWFLVNRLDAPLFVSTITAATLYTTGFGRKRLLYKLSIYLFILSMIFFFIKFAQMLVGGSYRY